MRQTEADLETGLVDLTEVSLAELRSIDDRQLIRLVDRLAHRALADPDSVLQQEATTSAACGGANARTTRTSVG